MNYTVVMHNAGHFIDNGCVHSPPMVCTIALNSNAKPDHTATSRPSTGNILQSNVFVSHDIFAKCQVLDSAELTVFTI